MRNLRFLGAVVSVFFTLSCSRAVGPQESSQVSFNFASSTLSTSEINTLVVAITGPSMTPITFEYHKCRDTACAGEVMPTSQTFIVPKGPDRLIQVLIAKSTSTSQEDLSYAESQKSLTLDREEVNLTPELVSGYDLKDHTTVFGRACGRSSGRSLLAIALPGKTPMPFRTDYFYDGYFKVDFPSNLPLQFDLAGSRLVTGALSQYHTAVTNESLISTGTNSSNGGTDTRVAKLFDVANCSGTALLPSANEDVGNEAVGNQSRLRYNSQQLSEYSSPWGNRFGPLDYFRVALDSSVWKLAWTPRAESAYVRIFRRVMTSSSGGSSFRFDCKNPSTDFTDVGGALTGNSLSDTSASASSNYQYVGCAYHANDIPLEGFSQAQGCASSCGGGN